MVLQKANQVSENLKHLRRGGIRDRLCEISNRVKQDDLAPAQHSDLLYALTLEAHINKALRIMADLPDEAFRSLARRVTFSLCTASVDLQMAYFRRVIDLGMAVQPDIARDLILPTVKHQDPVLLESFLEISFPHHQKISGVLPLYQIICAITSARDPGCGAILARILMKSPASYFGVLRIEGTQLANNPKPALAILIANHGVVDEASLGAISRELRSKSDYAALFAASAHGDLARRAYAWRWDLEQFVGLPLREIRKLDARAGGAI